MVACLARKFERDLPGAERRYLTVMFCDRAGSFGPVHNRREGGAALNSSSQASR
jgi:hypothetical protein